MAQDEWRHAGCYFAFLKEAVKAKPEYLENIGRMTLWMLRGRLRHPTNITTPSVMGQLADPDFFVNMLNRFISTEAELSLNKRILNLYSILAGQTITSPRELAHYLKNKFGRNSLEIAI